MAEKNLKIATWNLMRPTKLSMRNVNILRELERIDADILVLTETNSCIDLSKRYPTCFSTTSLFESISIGTGAYSQGENRVTIWSKFSGQKRSDMCNSHSGICALLKCDAWGELNVYGTILGIYGKNRGRYEPGLGRTDFQTAVEVQIIDWERLVRLGNLCVAGDFNTAFKGRYFTQESRERLVHCFRKLDIEVPTRDIEDNIDHIALSKPFLELLTPNYKIRTWNDAKDMRLLSDHMGVCLTLEHKLPTATEL